MYDDMLTAGEVGKFYGAGALHLLQTMRVGLMVGPDRREPNRYGGTTQLFKNNRVQQAAVYAVGGAPAEQYCSQAFFCGLFGISRQAMLPEQEVYFPGRCRHQSPRFRAYCRLTGGRNVKSA